MVQNSQFHDDSTDILYQEHRCDREADDQRNARKNRGKRKQQRRRRQLASDGLRVNNKRSTTQDVQRRKRTSYLIIPKVRGNKYCSRIEANHQSTKRPSQTTANQPRAYVDQKVRSATNGAVAHRRQQHHWKRETAR